MKAGQQVTIDGWREAVVCDVRADGSFFTSSGDNVREQWTPGDSRITEGGK